MKAVTLLADRDADQRINLDSFQTMETRPSGAADQFQTAVREYLKSHPEFELNRRR
jgi:cephalosporin hydroxylase